MRPPLSREVGRPIPRINSIQPNTTMTPQDARNAQEAIFQQALGAKPLVLDTPLDTPCRAIYVGTGGDATLTFANGTVVTFTELLSGAVYPFAITKVSTSGTTAANIIALY